MMRITLFAVLLLLAGCGGSGAGADRNLSVEASEFQFAPARLDLKTGERVRLRVTNKGAQDHDLNIRDMPTSGPVDSRSTGGHTGAHESALHVFTAAGKSGTLDFTPSQAGTYEVYCSVAGHKEAGMTAQITVQ